MKLKSNDTVIFLGDSVTDCGRTRPDGEWGLGDGYPEIVDSMYRVLHPECPIRYINKGVSGDLTRDVLARLQADVLDYHPNVVTLLIGINDVWRFFDRPAIGLGIPEEQYRVNMKTIIEAILGCGAQLLLMTPYMIDTNPAEPMRVKMLQYAQICKELAAEYKLELLELQPVFEDLLAKGLSTYELSPDRIHPNTRGRMAIALELLKRLTPAE